MEKIIKRLVGKKFTIYSDGSFEKNSSFIELVDLLLNESDFRDLSTKERTRELERGLKNKVFYFDDEIEVRIK